jgi:hypothetical protein
VWRHEFPPRLVPARRSPAVLFPRRNAETIACRHRQSMARSSHRVQASRCRWSEAPDSRLAGRGSAS